MKMHNTGIFNDGGTPEADAHSQADAWSKMLKSTLRTIDD
jgi:hypothetical protein